MASDSVGLLNRTNSMVSNSSKASSTTTNSSESTEEEFTLNMVNLGESVTGSLRHQDSQQVQASFQSSQLVRPNLMSMVHHKWKKMWKRDSAEITPNDPSYKTIYLGNVVTTWAKGEGCLDRPASALWKNHCQGRGSIKMVISVAPSGLKAQTREHGLTEYWANRLTWCGVPPDYPKLFCWIYRHEARKLKQELRCHAVLCTKEDRASRLADSLRNRLAEALFDFKKEKLLRQNARLSIVQSLYNTSATKRRLVLLNTNSQNYKPPLERSKSAPKLSCIEEFEEEDFEEGFEGIAVASIPESESVPVVGDANDHGVTSTVFINHLPQIPLAVVSGSPVVDSKPEDQENVDLLLDDEGVVVTRNSTKNAKSSSPVEHRKSYAHPPTHHQIDSHPDGSQRRPHTVPMDAKLNLPYMTGYDKVMQLLEMPTSSDTHRLLMDGEDDEEFFPQSNSSDPVASSPGSDASESVVDSCCEDEFGKHLPRRRGSTERNKAGGDDSPGEEEINDNVSDESGYSEEATVVLRRSSGTSNDESSTDGDQVCTDLSLNLDPRGSPTLKKSSTNNTTNSICLGKRFEKSTTIYIRGTPHLNEPVEIAKSKERNNKLRSNCDGESPSCPSTTTLMVYDNMCFEI